jgi:hypothetical protein
MRILDQKGRLFGKVSVIDLLILLAVVGLGLGYVYQRTSPEILQIVNADTKFYVTMTANRMRGFSVDAVDIGDIMYKQHDRQPLGTVVKLETEPATDYMLYPDGTAVLVEMEERYRMYITLESTGSITDVGYHVNGIMHIAPGSEIVLVSNRLLIPDSWVHAISETMP